MTRPIALLISAPLVVLVGCHGGAQKISATPPAGVASADALHVQSSHTPINWDGRPGPDGLMVLVLLFQHSRDLPVPVRGTIEFALYHGVVDTTDIAKSRPAHSWAFRGQQLEACLTRTVWGWGYAMRLGWGSTVPTTSSVTLRAKHIPETGPPLLSDPIIIPVGPR